MPGFCTTTAAALHKMDWQRGDRVHVQAQGMEQKQAISYNTYIQVFPKYILLFWWHVDFFAHKSLPSHSQSQWHIGQWQTEMEIF